MWRSSKGFTVIHNVCVACTGAALGSLPPPATGAAGLSRLASAAGVVPVAVLSPLQTFMMTHLNLLGSAPMFYPRWVSPPATVRRPQEQKRIVLPRFSPSAEAGGPGSLQHTQQLLQSIMRRSESAAQAALAGQAAPRPPEMAPPRVVLRSSMPSMLPKASSSSSPSTAPTTHQSGATRTSFGGHGLSTRHSASPGDTPMHVIASSNPKHRVGQVLGYNSGTLWHQDPNG